MDSVPECESPIKETVGGVGSVFVSLHRKDALPEELLVIARN